MKILYTLEDPSGDSKPLTYSEDSKPQHSHSHSTATANLFLTDPFKSLEDHGGPLRLAVTRNPYAVSPALSNNYSGP